jgi:hypothetical protein
MKMEQLVEWELEAEVLRENLPQPNTDPTRSDMGSNPGRRGGKPSSYGTTGFAVTVFAHIGLLCETT